ncbi:MAG: pirin family protein [Candidatus Eisenbacteria bacterium]|nr:pirin family protein [Candidatus Eisenbacteria bacterium]
MITLRPATERGHVNWGWLDTYHTFSFGDYNDPSHMGFRSLRVINDDRVAGGGGFPPHRHRDMEIITWVLDGALEHKDSMGNGSVIRPGQLQFMRAGTGVEHSEFNHSKTDPVHLLQIWIIPEKKGLTPAYAELTPTPEALAKDFVVVAAKGGPDGAIDIAQDASLAIARLATGDRRSRTIAEGRHAWLHVATGSVVLNGTTLGAGDGASVTGPETLELAGSTDTEVLLFELR